MDNRLKIRTENGVKIMFVDLSNLAPDEIVNIFPALNEKAIENRIRLYIFDITNTHTTQEIKHASRASIDTIESKLGKIASALIGLTGIQKIIANAISKDQYFAKDEADAVKWVLEQAVKMNIGPES
ncbi:hypothetical protein JW948_03820 [bacterium]|nr:hypothetical protein [bacterium]